MEDSDAAGLMGARGGSSGCVFAGGVGAMSDGGPTGVGNGLLASGGFGGGEGLGALPSHSIKCEVMSSNACPQLGQHNCEVTRGSFCQCKGLGSLETLSVKETTCLPVHVCSVACEGKKFFRTSLLWLFQNSGRYLNKNSVVSLYEYLFSLHDII